MDERTLIDRWKAANRPDALELSELIELLSNRYSAYLIPTEVYGSAMFTNDEQLTGSDAITLLTITHPDTLRNLFSSEEAELHSIDANTIDEYARSLFLGYPRSNDDPVSGDFLNMEHALGRRLTIAIAHSGESITGYRQFGVSEKLAKLLRAYLPVFIPMDTRSGNEPYPDEFISYLRGLAETGRI